MTKKTIYINLILFIACLFIIHPAIAKNAISTESAIPQEKVKQKIKEKLEEVIHQGLDKIKGAITQKENSKIYAYVGEIKTIEKEKISINTEFDLKQIKIASQATIFKITPQRQKIILKGKNLKPKQFIIAMGHRDANKVLNGSRIIITSKITSSDSRKVLAGKITEIDGKKITFKTSQEKQTINIDKKTKLKIDNLEKPTIDDCQIGDRIRAIVTLDKNQKVNNVKTVFIIPGETNPVATENEVEATPSASPS